MWDEQGAGIICLEDQALLSGKYKISMVSANDGRYGIFEVNNQDPRKLREFIQSLESNPPLILTLANGGKFSVRLKLTQSLFVFLGTATFAIQFNPAP